MKSSEQLTISPKDAGKTLITLDLLHPLSKKGDAMKKNHIRINCYVLTAAVILFILCAAVFQALADTPPPPPTPNPAPAYNLALTLSDGAQGDTIAFDGFAFITGNLDAQTFFPPGKVADYWGFQYLRDNTPDGNGHNTDFLTNCSYNVLYILNAEQIAQLLTLANNQVDQINLYGYKRYPLMMAFNRLLNGNTPTGSTGLSLSAVKAASSDLYQLDGQMSFDRAVVYARIYRSLTESQKSYLNAMSAGGFASWTVTPDMMNVVNAYTQGASPDLSQAFMTFAGDLFAWYTGSLNADVYFCPERQGTYFGSFYVKDGPAIGVPGYTISETLTSDSGQDFLNELANTGLDAQITNLVNTQRADLYAGNTQYSGTDNNIVQVRTDISTLLLSLVTASEPSDAFKSQVLSQVLNLSQTYGNLDGEIIYSEATAFAQVYQSMTATQKSDMTALRKSDMSGTYTNDQPFDFSVCTTPFLYSNVITDMSTLDPYISNTDYLFGVPGTGVLSISPSVQEVFSSNAGSTSFSVSNAGTGTLTWTASVVSGNSWLSISSGSSGSNAGNITCSLAANTGASPRTGTIQVTASGAAESPVDIIVIQGGTSTSASTPATTACTATLSSSLDLSVPYVIQPDSPTDTSSLWMDFTYESNPTSPSSIIFKLVNSGTLTHPSFSCAASSLSNEMQIYIPDVLLPNGGHLWAELTFNSDLSTDGNDYFVVTHYGAL